MSKRFIVLVLILVFMVPGGIPSGTAQVMDKHEVSVRLVLVDVTAMDADGAFVDDLRSGDFQIFEDGRPVALRSAELVHSGTAAPHPVADAETPFFVVFDSINTIRRMLDRKRSEIIAQLTALVNVGRRVMVLELAENGEMKVLQAPTADAAFIGRAVEKAAGSIWVEKAADSLSLPSILKAQEMDAIPTDMAVGGNKWEKSRREVYELETRLRFEKTVNGLLAAFQVIKTYPGRKPVLFVSSGLPSISFGSFMSGQGGGIEDATAIMSQVSAAKVHDPFSVLRKKGVKSGDEILESLVSFANSHNISLYALDPDNYLRYLLGDMAYDNYPRALPRLGIQGGAGMSPNDQIGEIRKVELSKLDSLARDTSGQSYLGGDRFKQFKSALDRDLSKCYELSYTPPRKNPDGKYHKITVKTTRAGVTLRARSGYHDYDENQKASIVLASASVQPALFNDVSFEARVVPFIQGRNRFVLWVLMALPTGRLLGDGRDLDKPCRLRFQVTVNEKEGGQGSVSDVTLPIVLSPAFLQKVKRASFFGLSLRSGEMALDRDAYRVAVALYDMDYGSVGTVQNDLSVGARGADAASVANIVPGTLIKDEDLRNPGFSISETDGTFLMPGYRFYPMAVAHWERGKSAAVVLQVRAPQRPSDPRPSFTLRGAGGGTAEIAAEKVQDSWDKKANAWTAVYKVAVGDFAPGPAELIVTWTGATGPAATQSIPLTIL